VWEIAAQSEPHTDVDPVDVGALIRYVFAFCCNYEEMTFELSSVKMSVTNSLC